MLSWCCLYEGEGMGKRARKKMQTEACGDMPHMPSQELRTILIFLPIPFLCFICFPLCMDSPKKRQEKGGTFKCGQHRVGVGEMAKLPFSLCPPPTMTIASSGFKHLLTRAHGTTLTLLLLCWDP